MRPMFVFSFLAALAIVSAHAISQGSAARASDTVGPKVLVPVFEVDPFWPKPLPDHWVTGATIGLSIDAQDNVWTLHRPESVDDNFRAADLTVADAVDDEALPGAAGPVNSAAPIGACCKVAPQILVYDSSGALVKSWGGPGAGYQWPERNHGLTVDHKGNVWLGGSGETDTHILKFDGDGRFLLQVGKQGIHNGSNDLANFWKPSKIVSDAAADEVYISDGYGNRRVVVLDAETGAYKRHWGAYGNKPSDDQLPPYNPSTPPAQQFSTVHCVMVARDGLVYVCDRVNDRIQVFRRDGTFVAEAFVDPKTYRSGSVWDIAFSHDPEQTYLYVANGVDQKISILRRTTLEVLTSFGDGGRQPGQFFGVHNLAVDSKGNLYTTETYTGARTQRFVFKGLMPLAHGHQGVPWPQDKK